MRFLFFLVCVCAVWNDAPIQFQWNGMFGPGCLLKIDFHHLARWFYWHSFSVSDRRPVARPALTAVPHNLSHQNIHKELRLSYKNTSSVVADITCFVVNSFWCNCDANCDANEWENNVRVGLATSSFKASFLVYFWSALTGTLASTKNLRRLKLAVSRSRTPATSLPLFGRLREKGKEEKHFLNK